MDEKEIKDAYYLAISVLEIDEKNAQDNLYRAYREEHRDAGYIKYQNAYIVKLQKAIRIMKYELEHLQRGK